MSGFGSQTVLKIFEGCAPAGHLPTHFARVPEYRVGPPSAFKILQDPSTCLEKAWPGVQLLPAPGRSGVSGEAAQGNGRGAQRHFSETHRRWGAAPSCGRRAQAADVRRRRTSWRGSRSTRPCRPDVKGPPSLRPPVVWRSILQRDFLKRSRDADNLTFLGAKACLKRVPKRAHGKSELGRARTASTHGFRRSLGLGLRSPAI